MKKQYEKIQYNQPAESSLFSISDIAGMMLMPYLPDERDNEPACGTKQSETRNTTTDITTAPLAH